MWGYYTLTIPQGQTDRRASAGYTISPAAALEFPEEIIARSLAEHSESEKLRKQAVRQTAIATLYSAIKVFFQRPAAVAR